MTCQGAGGVKSDRGAGQGRGQVRVITLIDLTSPDTRDEALMTADDLNHALAKTKLMFNSQNNILHNPNTTTLDDSPNSYLHSYTHTTLSLHPY